MKRLLLLSALILPMARAQFFGGFATEFTQLANNLELVSIFGRQLRQLATALDTYNEIVRMGHLLKGMRWTSAQQDILNIAVIAQQGQGIAFSMAALDAQFRAAYPGYGAGRLPYYRRYQTWSQVALDTIRGTLRSTGLSWQQMQSEQAMINYFQSQAESLTTQQQALMLGNVLGAESLSQMNKLRQVMLADLQSKEAYQAYQVQKEVTAQEYEHTFFAPGKAGRDGVGW